MNILFIAPNFLPHIGGVEKHIDHLSKEMIKDGHSVTIVVQKFDSACKNYEKMNRLEIIRIEKKKSRLARRLKMLSYMVINIKKILQYDIIHFHDYSTFWSFGLGVYPLLKLFKKDIYITFHGWEGDVPPRISVILKRRLTQRLTTANISIGHFISKWYGTKADIVSYGGVDRVADLSENKENYILFVGRLADDTGIFDYMKAWEEISKKISLEFVICGDGVLQKELKKYVAQKNIQRVVFKGFVSDVEKYIKDAKIVLTSGYLGILEAFSYKKNVVAVYENDLKKDYLTMIPNHEKMMWVVDNDIRNITEAISEALKDNLKKEIAYKYSLENNWEKIKKDYYRLWSK